MSISQARRLVGKTVEIEQVTVPNVIGQLIAVSEGPSMLVEVKDGCRMLMSAALNVREWTNDDELFEEWYAESHCEGDSDPSEKMWARAGFDFALQVQRNRDAR